jgi:hypothetical protein
MHRINARRDDTLAVGPTIGLVRSEAVSLVVQERAAGSVVSAFLLV